MKGSLFRKLLFRSKAIQYNKFFLLRKSQRFVFGSFCYYRKIIDLNSENSETATNIFKLPSRFLIQKENHTFVATEGKSGVKNPCFAITPLVSDFNQDGYLDLIWENIGSKVMAYLNNGGNNNFLEVKMKDNARCLGAKVVVTTSSGKVLTEDFIVGEGLTCDQSTTIHFGLGKDEVRTIVVKFIDGTQQKLSPKTNIIINME